MSFAVIIDISGSARDKEAFLRDNSLKLFDALEQSGYRGIFGDFNDELYLSSKTNSHSKATEELKQVKFRGGTALYSAMAESAKELAKHSAPGERRAIFVFSDGEDNASNRSLKTALAETQSYGVSVYCIGVLGNDVNKKSLEALNTLSTSTGGVAILLNRPKEFMQPLLAAVKEQYQITLRTSIADNKSHSISISPNDRSLKVFAPTEFQIAKKHN